MRTRKESEFASGTHLLETGKDSSGHGKKATEQGILTSWRRQRERLVGTRKERNSARNTHVLEMAKGMICQDKERKRASEGHSLSGDGRWWRQDLSGQRNKASERGALTLWRWKTRELVRTRKESDNRKALTLWRWQREGLVRIRKESDRDGSLTSWRR